MPDPVSDGGTFEEMVEYATRNLDPTRHPWTDSPYKGDIERHLTAAGVPDLLSSLRAKDALIADYAETLRRHVMDWGECTTEACDCSHRQGMNLLADHKKEGNADG